MTTTAGKYHQITSYKRYEMKGHGLDWANRPAVYKIYSNAEYIPLPRPVEFPRATPQHTADPHSQRPSNRRALTIDRLSVILALTYGITGYVRTGGDIFHYRSAPSAGALYPVEIYMAVGAIDGLGSGLYHYDVSGHRLCRLRSENIMPFADGCIAGSGADSQPHVCFFLSAVTFRSAWKYRQRAFRYLLLDTGHVLENLLMALKAEGASATVHYDIHGDRANRLLGFDPEREICFACARVAGDRPAKAGISQTLDALPRSIIDAGRVASKEIVYREIEEMLLASSPLPPHHRPSSDMIHHLGLFPEAWEKIEPPHPPFEFDVSDAVINRRSRRNFTPDELSEDAFFNLLAFLSRTSATGQPNTRPAGSSMAVGLLVQNVKGVSSGFYLFDLANSRWAQIRAGGLCGAMAAVCLDQQWLQHAAMHFCFLADLNLLDQNWGARGYHYAMLSAGRLGQRIYLASAALSLGCCGIGALYDAEAKALLGLNQSSALLYLVAAGPVKR